MENDIYSKNDIIKKVIKIIFKIFYQILIIFCFILTAIIILQKIIDSNGSIGGYRIFRVITGSMIPQYDIGEVVISKTIDPSTIKVGDDIVYRGTYGEYNGKIIMHEVIGIDKDQNNNFTFHAKGLASGSVEDPQIKPSQIYGVVKYKSAILAILYDLATNIYTAFIIIFILVLNVFIAFKFPEKIKLKQLAESGITSDSDEDAELEDEEKIEENNDIDVEENAKDEQEDKTDEE